MEESIGLAGRLVGFGFRRAVCTSHRTRKYQNTPDIVMGACRALKEELDRNGIDMELVPSMEYRLIPETWPEVLEKDWLLPWEGNHILVELPIHDPAKIGDIVPEEEIPKLVDKGLRPVLAHPERYLYLDMDRYLSLKGAGALFQRNVGSMEGLYGCRSATGPRCSRPRGCTTSWARTSTASGTPISSKASAFTWGSPFIGAIILRIFVSWTWTFCKSSRSSGRRAP